MVSKSQTFPNLPKANFPDFQKFHTSSNGNFPYFKDFETFQLFGNFQIFNVCKI